MKDPHTDYTARTFTDDGWRDLVDRINAVTDDDAFKIGEPLSTGPAPDGKRTIEMHRNWLVIFDGPETTVAARSNPAVPILNRADPLDKR